MKFYDQSAHQRLKLDKKRLTTSMQDKDTARRNSCNIALFLLSVYEQKAAKNVIFKAKHTTITDNRNVTI
jgi:hypothetical protein